MTRENLVQNTEPMKLVDLTLGLGVENQEEGM